MALHITRRNKKPASLRESQGSIGAEMGTGAHVGHIPGSLERGGKSEILHASASLQPEFPASPRTSRSACRAVLPSGGVEEQNVKVSSPVTSTCKKINYQTHRSAT